MKSAKTFIALSFLLAFAFQVSAQKSKDNPIKLSTRDKKEIIKQVFDDSFEKLMTSSEFSQCFTPIVDDKQVIFLKSEIDKNFLPNNFNEYRFMIMSYSQISEEVEKNNGECYFELSEFRIINSKIRVNLSRIIDEIHRFKDSSKYSRWIGGESYYYDFKKAKRWKIFSSGKSIISS